MNRTLRRDNPGWINTGVCAWHQFIILSWRCDGLPRNPTASAQDGQFLAVNACRIRWVTQGCVHQQNCQGVTHGSVGNQAVTALSYSTLLDGTQRRNIQVWRKFNLSCEQLDVKFKHHKNIVMDNGRHFWEKRILFGEAGLHSPVNSSCWSLFMSCNCLGKSTEVREHQQLEPKIPEWSVVSLGNIFFLWSMLQASILTWH